MLVFGKAQFLSDSVFFGGSRRSTFLFLKGGWEFLGFRVSSLGQFGAWVSFAQEAFLFGARELGLWDSFQVRTLHRPSSLVSAFARV